MRRVAEAQPAAESQRRRPIVRRRLFNGMIVPLAPYAIRGAIWYQGESNAGTEPLYGSELRTMIARVARSVA